MISLWSLPVLTMCPLYRSCIQRTWLIGLSSTTLWMNCRYLVMTGISRVRAYGRRRFAGTMASCGSASARQMKVFLSAIPRSRGGMERSALPARGQRLDRSRPFWDDNAQGLVWYMPSPIAAAASSINCSCLRWAGRQRIAGRRADYL